MATRVQRALVGCGGLIGALGVAAAAASSHGEAARNLGAMSTIFLTHGPALLAIGLAGRGRVLLGAATALASGTALFSGDLAARQWFGHSLFPGAAPLGGGLMILAWLGIAASALTRAGAQFGHHSGEP